MISDTQDTTRQIPGGPLGPPKTEDPPGTRGPADQSQAPGLVQFASPSTISGTFNSLFKVLFIFPSQYLFAIGLVHVFSFRWNLPPT